MTRKLTPADVTFDLSIDPEDMQVQGNYMCTDDPEQDKADEYEIIARLESGDECAWCVLVVRCGHEPTGLTGIASLGGVVLSQDY